MNTEHMQHPCFNSALEAALRAIVILAAVYPRKLDLQQLVTFDHLIVHTEDVDGPESLHPQLPLRNAEILVRRRIVEHGLFLLISKKLAERVTDNNGIYYEASDYATPFLSALESDYTSKLKERAFWLDNTMLQLNERTLQSRIEKVFGKWTQEFQTIEKGFGVKE